jgi:uncharacterized protein
MIVDRHFYTTKKALQALCLFVPAASIGVVMATYISPGIIGQGIFTLIKAWLIVFPIFWRLKVEKKSIKFPKINLKQINFGLILGLIMSVAILTTYWLIGQKFLNIVEVKEQAIAVGINNVKIYLLGVMYWSFVNSFIEESVWRGFVYRQCLIFQSVCYQKLGFWSCYFSHILADLAIGLVGWHLLFSPT